MAGRGTVLVVDDEALIRWAIVQCVQRYGFVGVEAADAREAMARVGDADVVILDYRLPDRTGFDVLRELHATKPTLPVIMLTAHSSVEHAVQAMKLGAFHYVSKPFDLDEMLALVEQALDGGARYTSIVHMTSASLVGDSSAIRDVRRSIARAAASSAPVLLTGEPGTGKQLAARAIHGESKRANGPFVTISCSSIPAGQLAGELFGREAVDGRAARVGVVEIAQGGTLMLDDVDAVGLELAHELLHLLREKTYLRIGSTRSRAADVRIVASTSVDLASALRDRKFGADLFDELSQTRVHMPSLREMREDIPILARLFLEQAGAGLGREAQFTPAAIEVLRQRRWPFNVSELRGAIERALLLHDGGEIGAGAVSEATGSASNGDGDFSLPTAGLDMEVLERDLLLQALERAGGNQRLAGGMLGMNRDQVRYRMAKYGIPGRRRRQEH